MGNQNSPRGRPQQVEFSFQPLLSYRLAKTMPSALIPEAKLKEQLPWLDWSLTDIRFFPEADEWGFLTQDWPLKRRWKVLVFASSDYYQQNVYQTQLQPDGHKAFKQIDKDVKRTYPTTAFFDDPQNLGIFSRVLKNIALYFPDSGYTQGVNFIVGFMIQCGFKEEEAFWLFIHLALSPDVFLMGYFQDEFPLANLSYDLFMFLMKHKYPALADKILRLELPKEIWVFQWFLTTFLNSFPVDMCKMIWDYMLVSGPFALVYLSLAIIDQTYSKLMVLKQDSDFGIYFQKLRDRKVLGKTLNIESLFAKAKQLQLPAVALSTAITRISQSKNYVNVYSQYYSYYDNPEKNKSIHNRYLREVKKERLLYRVNRNRNSATQTSNMINPIEFWMSESKVSRDQPQAIPSLVLLRHMKESYSRVSSRQDPLLASSNSESQKGYCLNQRRPDQKEI